MDHAGNLIYCVDMQLPEEYQWALLQDMTDLMTSPMPTATLDICVQLVVSLCLVSAASRSKTPIPPQTLQLWVTALCGTFVAQQMTNYKTLELLLQCNLCLCRVSGQHSDGTDKLLQHAVSLTLLNPSPSVPRSLQVRET